MSKGLDNLEIYKLAEKLEIFIYKVTKKFPDDEKYRSVDQLRRSSSSVTDNIAEGYGRYSFQDKINKFYIARGEAEETRKGIKKSQKKGFTSAKIADLVDEKYTQLIKQINAYINFLRHHRQIPNPQVPKYPSTQAFTLIELIVSMSILVVAIIAAMGVYINVIGSRERTLGQVNVQEDGQYLMSLMVKDIRAGIIDYANYVEIASPEGELLLLDFLNNQIRYRITPATPIIDGACSISRCTLERCENADCSIAGNYQTITMSDVSIERLDFYINPTEDPFTAGSTIYIHPRITIVLKLKSLIEKTGKEELILQQTVPQRYTYRK